MNLNTLSLKKPLETCLRGAAFCALGDHSPGSETCNDRHMAKSTLFWELDNTYNNVKSFIVLLKK